MSLLDDLAVPNHQYLVRVFNRAQSVRDNNRRSIGSQLLQILLDLSLGHSVQR